MNVSELIRQAVVNDNNDFEKVIFNVAVGLKSCGFFDKADWKKMLEQCFEKTSTEMELDSSELWDVESSYDIIFANILAESTSTPAGPIQIGKRVKRSSTLLHDADTLRDTRKKFKKSTRLRDDVEVANFFADLKETKWAQILPAINAKQSAVKYETIFERAKQLRGIKTATEVITSSDMIIGIQTLGEPLSEATACNSIRKRRQAFYLPPPKRKSKCLPVSDTLPVAVPVTEPLSNISKTENSANSETLDVTLSDINATLTNVTKRPMTRNQSQTLAVYSNADAAFTNIISQRDTSFVQRTSVLFTMIDALEYQDTLYKYNIFVADINDQYDYVIAERVCCSPKFLSAAVSGKPIVSIEWIHALNEKNVWLDPLNYLLKDDNGEEEAHVTKTRTDTSEPEEIY